jgi:hypothetical protein
LIQPDVLKKKPWYRFCLAKEESLVSILPCDSKLRFLRINSVMYEFDDKPIGGIVLHSYFIWRNYLVGFFSDFTPLADL